MHYFVNTEKGTKITQSNRELHTPYHTRFSQEQEDFYAQYPDATVSEIKNCEKITPPEKTIEDYKTEKIRDIDMYDSSENVNLFYYNDIPMWLDKATRVGLVNSCNSLEMMEEENINIWVNDMYITLNINVCRRLLSQLELYAMECYNTTAIHKSNVNSLDTIESVLEYDYTVNYPEKLRISENV